MFESVFEELGIPPKYLKKTPKQERFVALVHKQWLITLYKQFQLIDFMEKSRLEMWDENETPSSPWIKTFISVFKKKDFKVIPLPRIRPKSFNDDNPLLFAQLMQYVSESNFKNLWKQAYQKYRTDPSEDSKKEDQVSLIDYNDILREIILRLYGCLIVNIFDPTQNLDSSKDFQVHLNVLPTFFGVETLNAIFLFHIPFLEHNLVDCVTFSPAILAKCYSKPLFIIYQLIQLLKSLHDRSLTLGDISLNDIYLTEDLWIYVFPQVSSNIYIQPNNRETPHSMMRDCRKFGHKFDSRNLKCEFCGLRTFDKVQIKNENLEELCKLWIQGNISNFTYISALNRFSGRKLKDPNCHYVFPWVTDFASKCGRNWRDFRKSKFRLNKGDRQLDLTYDNSQNHQVPHHVSDVLSSITYYVYMARRTPKSILCKNIRSIWVPAEYPSSIQRMQEWTPDECIPEFFADPTVFKSIHEDLEDLEVPFWATSPEDFVEKHREALESEHVSERLHHWIDLTFGYKLSGSAAIRSKNVCLNLVDDHINLIKSGIVQLFTQRHPSRSVTALYWNKLPPNKEQNNGKHARSRDKSSTSKSDEDENLNSNNSANNWGSLGISKYLSRSRSSLHEECAKSASTTSRSTSLGPKNPTFTSHVASKLKSNQLLVQDNNMSNGTIYLPKDFKSESGLEMLEKQFNFLSKTFHTESSKFYKISTTDDELKSENLEDKCLVQNAFTNFIYAENFDSQFCVKSKSTTKSYSFPLDNKFNTISKINEKGKTLASQFNTSEIISKRRIRELQVLGCLIVEIFLAKQLRSLNCNSGNISFPQRLKFCVTVMKSFQHDIPSCVSSIVKLLLQPDTEDLQNITYPRITSFGTPPPSAHLLLEPLIHSLIPFPRSFSTLYKILASLKEFKNVAFDLDILYHFDCDGSMCMEYESLERTKILLARNIAESKVKLCAKQLENFLNSININTEIEIVNILIPHIKELIEDPPTAVLSAWYLFDPIAKVCGTRRSRELLLGPILKLYEQEPSEYCIPYNGKIAKIYHHSFLLRLIVRFGLQCFLENFVTPLVEAVGGYKEFHKFDYLLHTHTEKIAKKTSHLKNMSDDNDEINKYSSCAATQMDNSKDEELFELVLDETEKNSDNQIKNLIEHLELNIASEDLSAAEEALDATLPENVDQLKSLEELNLNLTDDGGCEEERISTPIISIPNAKPINNVINIQCEIGSRKSESESLETLKTAPKTTKSKENDSKISEMSAESIIWLSHRLGPVLMARYLSRNLLKMLTLCYVGQENLSFIIKNEDNTQIKDISVISSRVIGDENAFKVLECLVSITALYGEKLILFQFLPHMTELVVLCKRKLTHTLEGGLISCLVLLKHLIPYLSDVTLMNQLQEILSGIIHPIVRILGSTKYVFPNGFIGRNILARKYVDTLYALSIRIRSAMTRKYLTVPALQRFFYIFDKAVYQKDENSASKENLKKASIESLASIDEAFTEEENTQNSALQEIKQVFTAELAFSTYVAFLKHIGENCLDVTLKNHDKIRKLCQIWEQELRNNKKLESKIADLMVDKPISSSSSVGTHINIIGNRIEIQEETESSSASANNNDLLLSLVSNRMENNTRHLKGNWFSYWAHEIGRSDKDTNFNFNQIQLQTFVGHTNSVKSIYILDNENSFLSGSRDKTVKLWSLRSQGDGSATSNCQWTYSAHKKSILSLTFIESLRLVASCDGAVHLWDPFMGSIVAQLESPKLVPVNVIKSLPSPSSLIFSATTEGCIKIIDARLASFAYDLKITINPSGLIRSLAISPSGNWIAAGQSSGNITVLDTRTGLILSTWRAHEGEILQVVAINEDSLVSSSLDQNISIWNITGGKFKHFMPSSNEPAHCLNIHNGKELISATTGNRIGIHSVISAGASYNNVKLRSDSFRGLLTAIGVLPLNRLLLLGADNGQITLHC